MARKQWWAASVHIFTNDFGADLRDEFGPVGLCMWVGFLAACKRSVNPGKISYTTESECLALMGLDGMELVDEDGEPFTLDDFWTFLGRKKKTCRTARRRLTYVTATRWEDWQKDASKQREAERKQAERARSESSGTPSGEQLESSSTAVGEPPDSSWRASGHDRDNVSTLTGPERNTRSRADSERTEPGQGSDTNPPDTTETRHDIDNDRDTSARARAALRAVGDDRSDR